MKTNKLKTIMLLMGLLFSVSLSAFEVDGIAYHITSSTDMTVEVISKSEKYSGDVVIPESIQYNGKEYSVTGIGKMAFYKNSGLTSISLSNSIITIGDQAFEYCSSLSSIIIPDNVSSIGSFAFGECNNLTSVNIGKSVSSISSTTFRGCSELTSIVVDSQNKKYDSRNNCNAIILTSSNILVVGCKSTKIPNNVTGIAYLAFWDCIGLTSLVVPNSVTNIEAGAFSGCANLTTIKVDDQNKIYDSRNNCNAIIETSSNTLFLGCKTSVIPNEISSIGAFAFDGCSGLTSVTIPNKVNSIGGYAFARCPDLTSINIPSNVISIGDYAFMGCEKLSSIVVPNGVTSIGYAAFEGCSGLTYVLIPYSVTKIEERTFNGCSSLNSITIPRSVISIGASAFKSCSGLTSITIPNSVTSIGSSAFEDCSNLTSFIFPNRVTSIERFVLRNCSNLKSITIPYSVTNINENAFYNCDNLTKVIVENPKPVTISSYTFYYRQNATLCVPKGSKAAYESADYWKEFKEIVEITKSSYLEVVDTVGFTGKQLVLPINLTNSDDIAGVQFKLTLPQGVSVALNSKDKLMFSKTERDADHTLSGSKADDGTYTVLLYSADSEAITGSEGSIIDVTIDIDKEMKDGTYEIKLSDIVLSTTKAEKITTEDVTAQLEVKSYVLGDPNNDGSIDVVDITVVANYILGNNPENFIFAAADVDGDGTVDVNDIISIANIILYGSSSNAKPSMAKASNHLANNVTSNESNGDGFTVKNVSVEKGGTVKVDFELTNAAHDFSGIQMDIDLGEGLSFATKSNGKVNVTKGARLEDEDFTLSVAKQEGNQYRALGYYTDGSVIPEKSGTLFTLTLQADDSLADGKTFNCQLDNITLSTKNNEKIQQETQTFTVTIGDATGISDLFNEDCTPAVIYDLTGKRIETPAKSGQVIIIKKGGKVVKVFKK